VLFDIDFHQPDLAAMRAHHLFEDGRELLAGLAPARPEVDHDGHLARGFQHVLGEAGRGRVLDDVAVRAARGGCAGFAKTKIHLRLRAQPWAYAFFCSLGYRLREATR
jgi:hypothetical protein